MQKPRMFVASSVESLDVADAINVYFDHAAEVTVWRHGFKLSTDSIASLQARALASDFAVFVFTPDDVTTIRQHNEPTVRDNVLFELGLFIGAIGKERCFIVKPRGADLHIPTDLIGLAPADYDGNRSDGNLPAAVNAPCTHIKSHIEELGILLPGAREKVASKKPKYSYPIGPSEHLLMLKILEHSICDPDGASMWRVVDDKQKRFDAVSLIKLERLGMVERTIVAEMNGEYYALSLTADGTDYLLENEQEIRRIDGGEPEAGKPQDFDSFDDDIPF
ncbi:MAG: nucleotide-binding protein [Pseudomonadales bacterium]|nr:nucleotide-binding protein [Pseudomonadales bacterium]